MNKYQCQVCGAVSYSAASQENLKDNSCLECDGRVETVEGDKMNADEIVRIDEAVKALHRLSVLLVTPDSIVCCEAADLIESLQAQLNDVVPVVRCGECEYYQDNNGGYPHGECRWGHDETPDADDFCSCGKRLGVEP